MSEQIASMLVEHGAMGVFALYLVWQRRLDASRLDATVASSPTGPTPRRPNCETDMTPSWRSSTRRGPRYKPTSAGKSIGCS